MSSYLKKGKIVEQIFIAALEEKLRLSSNVISYEINNSSKEDDINKHIDIFLTYTDEDGEKHCSFDVKGLKKRHRSDKKYMENESWIELVNVNGNKGWLYGKEDYIAFETKDNFIIVRKSELIPLVTSKCTEETIYNELPEENYYYKYYQRRGKCDKMIIVPFSDLETMNSYKKINKV